MTAPKRADGDGSQPPPPRPSSRPDGPDRRAHARFPVTWAVDCSDGETFLYAYITNISTLGIFIASRTPPPVNTEVTLRFSPPGEGAFEVRGEVAWINPWHLDRENINPGFGVRFVDLEPDMRERLVSLVRAIAYLPAGP